MGGKFFSNPGQRLPFDAQKRRKEGNRNPVEKVGIFFHELQIPFFGVVKKETLDASLLQFQGFFSHQPAVPFDVGVLFVSHFQVRVWQADKNGRFQTLKIVLARLLGNQGGVIRGDAVFRHKFERDFIAFLVHIKSPQQASIDKTNFFLKSIGMDVKMLRPHFRDTQTAF